MVEEGPLQTVSWRFNFAEFSAGAAGGCEGLWPKDSEEDVVDDGPGRHIAHHMTLTARRRRVASPRDSRVCTSSEKNSSLRINAFRMGSW